MSNTKREPLLSDKDINDPKLVIPLGAKMIRDIYEHHRAKDAELIQQLVDEVSEWMQPNLDERFRGEQWHQSKRILDAAATAGFKPSDQ
jgi:hypothetical protein